MGSERRYIVPAAGAHSNRSGSRERQIENCPRAHRELLLSEVKARIKWTLRIGKECKPSQCGQNGCSILGFGTCELVPEGQTTCVRCPWRSVCVVLRACVSVMMYRDEEVEHLHHTLEGLEHRSRLSQLVTMAAHSHRLTIITTLVVERGSESAAIFHGCGCLVS